MFYMFFHNFYIGLVIFFLISTFNIKYIKIETS